MRGEGKFSDRNTARACELRNAATPAERLLWQMRFQNTDVLGNVDGVITTIRIALHGAPTPGPSRKREGGS